MLQRQMSDDVRKYILKAHEEQFVEFGEHEPKSATMIVFNLALDVATLNSFGSNE